MFFGDSVKIVNLQLLVLSANVFPESSEEVHKCNNVVTAQGVSGKLHF